MTADTGAMSYVSVTKLARSSSRMSEAGAFACSYAEPKLSQNCQVGCSRGFPCAASKAATTVGHKAAGVYTSVRQVVKGQEIRDRLGQDTVRVLQHGEGECCCLFFKAIWAAFCMSSDCVGKAKATDRDLQMLHDAFPPQHYKRPG